MKPIFYLSVSCLVALLVALLSGASGCGNSVSSADASDGLRADVADAADAADAVVAADADVVADAVDDVRPVDVRDADDTGMAEVVDATDIFDTCSADNECTEQCGTGLILCDDGKCHQCCGDADCTIISSACTCNESYDCVMQFGTECQPGVLQCDYPHGLPIAWGPAGVANSLHVPANVEEKTGCFDYTGDGNGDCGLTGMGSQFNTPLEEMITAGKIAFVLEFDGVEDLTNNPAFNLYLTTGTPTVEGVLAGEVNLDSEDYLFNMDTCEPSLKIEAQIVDGVLTGQAGNLTVRIYVAPELTLSLDLLDVHISAGVVASDDGVEVANGVLSAVLMYSEFNAFRESIFSGCDLDPIPEEVVDLCPFRYAFGEDPRGLFDLHVMDDGTYIPKDLENYGDAMSLCMKFTLAPATIVGYRP